jgi:thioredoxin-like negative regulator of GroEL
MPRLDYRSKSKEGLYMTTTKYFEGLPRRPFQVLHFHVPSCSVSQDLSEVLEEVADNYEGELEFKQVNLENSPANELLVEHEVFSLPTLLFLEEGIPLARISGFVPRRKLEEKINQLLKKDLDTANTTCLLASLFRFSH